MKTGVKEVTIGGYTLRLVEILPACPSGREVNYQVYIAFYPAENPAKLLFVEHYTTRDGRTISETGKCPMLHIDFPTYFFSSPRQELRYGGIGTPPGADTTLLIYGSGLSLTNDAGGGAASGLTAVSALPHSDGTSSTAVLTTVSANGTISVTFNGKSLTIPPGTTWTDTTRSIDTTSKNCRMNITQVERISNFGFLLPYQVIPAF